MVEISLKNDLNLVLNTFKKINLKEYELIHSDHGIQYTSKIFKDLLAKNNVVQSMSDIGNSLHNRPIEYWFFILKEEHIKLININKMEISDINKSIRKFINYYNHQRIQLILNGNSPNKYFSFTNLTKNFYQ